MKQFPDNEVLLLSAVSSASYTDFPGSPQVKKGMYNMELKKLEKKGAAVVWPKDSNDLPVLTWEQFQEQHKTSGRSLMVVGGCESFFSAPHFAY